MSIFDCDFGIAAIDVKLPECFDTKAVRGTAQMLGLDDNEAILAFRYAANMCVRSLRKGEIPQQIAFVDKRPDKRSAVDFARYKRLAGEVIHRTLALDTSIEKITKYLTVIHWSEWESNNSCFAVQCLPYRYKEENTLEEILAQTLYVTKDDPENKEAFDEFTKFMGLDLDTCSVAGYPTIDENPREGWECFSSPGGFCSFLGVVASLFDMQSSNYKPNFTNLKDPLLRCQAPSYSKCFYIGLCARPQPDHAIAVAKMLDCNVMLRWSNNHQTLFGEIAATPEGFTEHCKSDKKRRAHEGIGYCEELDVLRLNPWVETQTVEILVMPMNRLEEKFPELYEELLEYQTFSREQGEDLWQKIMEATKKIARCSYHMKQMPPRSAISRASPSAKIAYTLGADRTGYDETETYVAFNGCLYPISMQSVGCLADPVSLAMKDSKTDRCSRYQLIAFARYPSDEHEDYEVLTERVAEIEKLLQTLDARADKQMIVDLPHNCEAWNIRCSIEDEATLSRYELERIGIAQFLHDRELPASDFIFTTAVRWDE